MIMQNCNRAIMRKVNHAIMKISYHAVMQIRNHEIMKMCDPAIMQKFNYFKGERALLIIFAIATPSTVIALLPFPSTP